MIQLTDKLIAVLVPKDAHSFWDKLSYEGGYWLVIFEPRIEPYLALQSVRITGKSKDKFKIIGTVTEDNIDFDCEKYVEYYDYNSNLRMYKDYNFPKSEGELFDYDFAYQSFNSLLNSKGLFLDKLHNQKILILEKIKD